MNSKPTAFILSCAGALLATLLYTPVGLQAEERTELSVELPEISVIGSIRPVRAAVDAPLAVVVMPPKPGPVFGENTTPDAVHHVSLASKPESIVGDTTNQAS